MHLKAYSVDGEVLCTGSANFSTSGDQRLDAQVPTAMRLPEGGEPAPKGAGLSRSAASRHFVALSAARLKEWIGGGTLMEMPPTSDCAAHVLEPNGQEPVL